jgi:glycosyltransferase involved in cell wall biosynthesis
VNKETGLLFPPGDLPSLTGSLRLLLSDPNLRKRMGVAARLRMQECFSVESMAQKYMMLYHELSEMHTSQNNRFKNNEPEPTND